MIPSSESVMVKSIGKEAADRAAYCNLVVEIINNIPYYSAEAVE